MYVSFSRDWVNICEGTDLFVVLDKGHILETSKCYGSSTVQCTLKIRLVLSLFRDGTQKKVGKSKTGDIYRRRNRQARSRRFDCLCFYPKEADRPQGSENTPRRARHDELSKD